MDIEIGDSICYYGLIGDNRKRKGVVTSITQVKEKGYNRPLIIGFHLTTSEGIMYVANNNYNACRILLIEKIKI